jgi:crotonobetainyl-CoA:carnitine CoA-transferase CaiB-like acyl-CoA transferase
MTLGDLGAEVIKVEAPGRGDDTRHWGPPFTRSGLSAYFLCANRNKQSLTLDLKTPAGQRVLRELIACSDVLVENFRAGTMEAWGLDWDALRALRPDLIYCTITGYGYGHAYSGEPGYDFMLQARGGLMSITGPDAESPHKVGVAITDIVTGLFAVGAINAALASRKKSDAARAQRIDMALFDAQVAALANVASNFLVSGERPAAYGNAHPNIVPYQAFEGSEGSFAIGVGSESLWEKLCALLGRGEWFGDERFASNPKRVENRDALVPLLQDEFRKRPAQAWIDALSEAGIPCAPINAVDQVFDDPRASARGLRVDLEVDGDVIPMVASAMRIPTAPAEIRRPPPALGADSDAVLNALGYSSESIAALRADGVV